jgi:hypothetical protein
MSKLIIKTKYSVIPNDLVNSDQISLKAKGLFAYIQSKPDGWDFSAERIANHIKEGLQSVSSALKELEKSGYLVREKRQNEWGHWDVEYILNEIPTIENPTYGNPVSGNPTFGNPMPGKPSNNIKQLNTKQENKERVKTRRDQIFDLWFKYKAEKKQKYTETGKVALLKKWDHITDDQLEDFVNHSMANNYSGIFEKSVNSNNNGNSTGEKLGTSAARLEALRNW